MYDLKKYGEAKAILPHLDAILKVLDLTERSLSFYKGYIPVSKILDVVSNQKRILKSYAEMYRKVKATKGKK